MKIEQKYIDGYLQVLNKEIEEGTLSGASVGVFKDGSEVFRGEYGHSDQENQVPMKADTIFRLYSMTKPITATAIMMLFERGLICLQDPVSMYLEGFKNQKVVDSGKLRPVQKEVTIQNLLNMTSGVVYMDTDKAGVSMNELFDRGINAATTDRPMSTVEFANQIGQCPLAFEPGTKWRYGASTDVLGAIVEVVSGKSFRGFLKDELFEPLGMVDTDFYVPQEKWHRLAQAYEYNPSSNTIAPYNRNHLLILDFKEIPAFQSGGAGLVSTMEDYRKFAEMLLAGGTVEQHRYLGRKTVQYMMTNQLTTAQLATLDWEELAGYGYGNCMRVLMDPVAARNNSSLGEFGWGGWMGTYVAMDPVDKIIFLFFMQRVEKDTTALIRKLKAITYGSMD